MNHILSNISHNSHFVNRYLKFIEFVIKNKQKDDEYMEKHHIIPTCIGGGNEKSNLILLTARQHYIAHLILSKCFLEDTHKRKLTHAFRMMNVISNDNAQRYVPNSKIYEILKKNHNLNLKGSELTEETKKKIGEKSKIKEIFTNPEKNKEWRKKLSEIHKKRWTKELKEEQSKRSKGSNNYWYGKPRSKELNPMYKKGHSEESKKKISEARLNFPLLICPWCDLQSKNISNMKRYHFDFCLKNPNSLPRNKTIFSAEVRLKKSNSLKESGRVRKLKKSEDTGFEPV